LNANALNFSSKNDSASLFGKSAHIPLEVAFDGSIT